MENKETVTMKKKSLAFVLLAVMMIMTLFTACQCGNLFGNFFHRYCIYILCNSYNFRANLSSRNNGSDGIRISIMVYSWIVVSEDKIEAVFAYYRILQIPELFS